MSPGGKSRGAAEALVALAAGFGYSFVAVITAAGVLVTLGHALPGRRGSRPRWGGVARG
jgi:hypothetical protein